MSHRAAMSIARLRSWMLWSLACALACTRAPIELEGSDTGSSGDASDDGDGRGSDALDASGSDDSAGDGDTTGDPLPACGDGLVDPGETCDDANSTDGDGCNVDCRPSGELSWIAELPAGADGGFFPHAAVVGPDDAVTIAGLETDTAGLFVARWDAEGAQRFAVSLEHGPEASPTLGGLVVRMDGSVRVASRETAQSLVHHLDANGSATGVTAIGGEGASIFAMVAAPSDGWWAVGRREDGRVFAELRDGDDAVARVVDTDLVAFPRDAAATADGIVVLADADFDPQPRLLSLSADGSVDDDAIDIDCGGGLSLTSAGLRVVNAPQWGRGPVNGPCVLEADGTPTASPWSVPLVDGTTYLAVGPSDRLVAAGRLPDDTMVIQSQLADGGAAWSSEHTTGDPYLLPFDVAVGASGRIAVPAVSLDRTGAASAVVFVFAP
jgi:cysteine-rich repeat protein